MTCSILQLSYLTESILTYIASEKIGFRSSRYNLSKIDSIDDKNVTINFATAMDEIITTHSEGHAYLR